MIKLIRRMDTSRRQRAKAQQPLVESVRSGIWDHRFEVILTISRKKSHRKCMVRYEA